MPYILPNRRERMAIIMAERLNGKNIAHAWRAGVHRILANLRREHITVGTIGAPTMMEEVMTKLLVYTPVGAPNYSVHTDKPPEVLRLIVQRTKAVDVGIVTDDLHYDAWWNQGIQDYNWSKILNFLEPIFG